MSWRRAAVTGLKKRNAGGYATVYAISCLSPGHCLAGGHFDPIAGAPYVTEGFLVAQHDGTWRPAFPLPGIYQARIFRGRQRAALSRLRPSPMADTAIGHVGRPWPANPANPTAPANPARKLGTISSDVTAISCAHAGDCSAGGDYEDHSADDHSLVIGRHHGHWFKAIELPGGVEDGDQIGQVYAISARRPATAASAGSSPCRTLTPRPTWPANGTVAGTTPSGHRGTGQQRTQPVRCRRR